MKSVLSHIVHKQFSGEYENIATEALTYILQSNDRARGGLIKMLRGVISELPNLNFQTQQSEDNMRPDMWGLAGGKPLVFIENKFWAGLTEKQPVEYLKLLAGHYKDGILLMVVPAARQESILRELLQRLNDAGIAHEDQKPTADIPYVIKTALGPVMALSSWAKVLRSIDDELADEPQARNDLIQLRALCETAESDAYIPLSSAEITNQRFPAIVLQLNNVVRKAVEYGINDGFINVKGLNVSCTIEKIGRYIAINLTDDIYTWIGIHFLLWSKHGGSPLWLCFHNQKWGSIQEIQTALEPWAESKDIFTCIENNNFVLNIKIKTGEDFDFVFRDIVEQLKSIADRLASITKV